jgi:hypothetical protein
MAQIWFVTKNGEAIEVKNSLQIEKVNGKYKVKTGENTLEIFIKEKQAKEFIENLILGERVCYQR